MTFGSRVDDLIGDAIVAAGRIVDKAVNALARSDFNERAAQQFLDGSEQLADAEAQRDVLDPESERRTFREVGPIPDGPAYQFGRDAHLDIHLCTTWDGACHCDEVAEPLGEYTEVGPDDLISVKLADGTIRTERVGKDRTDAVERALRNIGQIYDAVKVLSFNTSAPGTATPVDAETPRVGIPPDAGPGLPTSDLLIAAANQLEVWLGTHWFRRLDERDTRELSTFRAAYLDELIPELRDRAAQFSAISD